MYSEACGFKRDAASFWIGVSVRPLRFQMLVAGYAGSDLVMTGSTTELTSPLKSIVLVSLRRVLSPVWS